jgi:hypothetical protein
MNRRSAPGAIAVRTHAGRSAEAVRPRRHGRETVEAKAARYLAEGRLAVVLVTADAIEATCHGATGTWLLGWHGGWHCDCPARTDRCAHLTALRLVTTTARSEEVAA